MTIASTRRTTSGGRPACEPELSAVRAAYNATIGAALAFEDTLLAAAEAGASLRQIAAVADASASTVLRAVRRAEERRATGNGGGT